MTFQFQRLLLIGMLMVVVSAGAFAIITPSSSRYQPVRTNSFSRTTILLSLSSSSSSSSPNNNENQDDSNISSSSSNNNPQEQQEQLEQQVVFVEPGSESDALSDDIWEEIEGAQPPKWIVMKEILGIGGFTYVLAALIVGMLSLNLFLGPGWLGQAMGVPGTGTFTEISPTLPDQIDLSADDFLF